MHQLNFQSMEQITRKDYISHYSSTWFKINFKGFDLSGENLSFQFFKGCDFEHQEFNGSIITNTTFIDCNFQSASFSDCLIENCDFINCDLTACDLQEKIELAKNKGCNLGIVIENFKE